jgi:hypothetical protein
MLHPESAKISKLTVCVKKDSDSLIPIFKCGNAAHDFYFEGLSKDSEDETN